MRLKRAFTLVEILIVVVILGILAAIVVPQFSKATEQAAKQATVSQLTKIREALGVYFVRNSNTLPQVAEGDASWGQIYTPGGDYMKNVPRNRFVNETAATTIVFGNDADAAYDPSRGWIYNPDTGDVWAAGFDRNDNPIPH